MLKRSFELHLPYRVVIYLRMSDPRQNPRSPEQQEAMIRERISLMKLPWTVVKVYRDDGISGRLMRKRKGYQQMMRDIKCGVVQADLILVDTFERFGRSDELPTIRKELWERQGMLILTVDSHFSDPTTPAGKALGVIDAMRASEDGRIKAHQVLRGKRDLALQGYWPGGPRPFGYKLVPSISVVNGNEVVLGSHLVPHPEEDWIVRLAFHRAKENGWGQDRTCRFLNDHQDIPQALKPFQSATVGRWLQNTIYKGHLSWNLHSTDIFCDARVIERNSPDEVLHIPDFCEPLVSKELWDEINELRAIRGEAISMGRRQLQGEEKLLKAPAPGLTLKYLLTGLVRCGHCGRAMVASSNKYTNRRGETVHYRSYCCPAYVGRNCDNSKRVPEEWLRETVISQLRQRLLPGS